MVEASKWGDSGFTDVLMLVERYGLYIFQARQTYNDVAGRVNRKYSLLIHKAMTYN